MKKALESPLSVMLHLKSFEVYLMNNTSKTIEFGNDNNNSKNGIAQVEVRFYEIDKGDCYSKQVIKLDNDNNGFRIDPMSSLVIGQIDVSNLLQNDVTIINLILQIIVYENDNNSKEVLDTKLVSPSVYFNDDNNNGNEVEIICRNMYWIHRKDDFRSFQWKLKPKRCKIDVQINGNNSYPNDNIAQNGMSYVVIVKNVGDCLAFFIRLQILKMVIEQTTTSNNGNCDNDNDDEFIIISSSTSRVLPVVYNDNFISLFPGESQIIEFDILNNNNTGNNNNNNDNNVIMYLCISGYNIIKQLIKLEECRTNN